MTRWRAQSRLFPWNGATTRGISPSSRSAARAPLHATALARELAVPEVVVPARPGITNAIGCVVADLQRDLVRTVNTPLSDLDPSLIASILMAQREEGETIIRRQGVAVEEITTLFTADMQFLGQSHILSVPLPGPHIPVEALQSLFEAAY